MKWSRVVVLAACIAVAASLLLGGVWCLTKLAAVSAPPQMPRAAPAEEPGPPNQILERTATDGAKWRIGINHDPEPEMADDLGAHAEAQPPSGQLATVEPLMLFVSAQSPKKGVVQLDIRFLTQDGRRLLDATRNGERPTPPKWRVLSAKGEAVASGSFEFG